MYNKIIKLIIALLIIAYAVYQFIEGFIGNGIMFILLSSIFIFLYFKNEFILLAFLNHMCYPKCDRCGYRGKPRLDISHHDRYYDCCDKCGHYFIEEK